MTNTTLRNVEHNTEKYVKVRDLVRWFQGDLILTLEREDFKSAYIYKHILKNLKKIEKD